MLIRITKEVLLSVFLLFFRISRWDGNMRARTAASGLTLVEGAAAASIWLWIEVGLYDRVAVNPWVVGIALVLLYSLNENYLVQRSIGENFGEEFSTFSVPKQMALYAAAIGMILAVAVSFYSSSIAYRHAFGLG